MQEYRPKDKFQDQSKRNEQASFCKYVNNLLPGQKHGGPFFSFSNLGWPVIGCIIGIGSIILIGQISFHEFNGIYISSLSMTACFILCTPSSVFAQPRNSFLGHIISAIVGMMVYQFLGASWFAALLCFNLSLLAMQLANTLHPPAVITSLIPVFSGQGIFLPAIVGVSVVALILLGVLLDKFALHRRYPLNWW